MQKKRGKKGEKIKTQKEKIVFSQAIPIPGNWGDDPLTL